MAAVDGPVHIESPIPIGGIQAAAAGIDVSISGTEARPGMGVAAEYPDGQAVGDPIVNTDAAPAGHKIIAPYLEPDHQA